MRRRAGDILSLVVAGVALVGAAVVVYDTASPERSYASAYDGTDPLHERCANSTGGGPGTKVVTRSTTPLREENGRVVGRLELRYSVYCGTVWPRFHVADPARRRTTGRFIRMAVERQSDNATAAYVLPLRGGSVGFGNMVAHQDSCVFGEVQLLASRDEPASALVRTECLVALTG